MRKRYESPAANERFGVMAAEARRNGSANLKACTPQKVQWKPPLRQAATTLAAMRDDSVVGRAVPRRKLNPKMKPPSC